MNPQTTTKPSPENCGQEWPRASLLQTGAFLDKSSQPSQRTSLNKSLVFQPQFAQYQRPGADRSLPILGPFTTNGTPFIQFWGSQKSSFLTLNHAPC